MARLTAAERADLEARLAADDEDDESDVVKITRTDGSAFEGSYRRAKKLGYVTEPEPKQGSSGGDGGGEVKKFQTGRRV
jgi:hypothetical protein